MTVLSYDSGDIFTVRIVKYLAANPSNKWANSYEFRATLAGSTDELLALGTALVSFEGGMHRTIVRFDRLLISTWEADSVPYDPATFLSTTLSASGSYTGTGDAEPLQMALSVTRQAQSGRFGHLFYRGFLGEGDVTSPAGIPTLVTPDDIQDQIDGQLTLTGLADYIGAAPAGAFGMVMVNRDGTQVRPVTGLRAQGVSSVPLDHAWFNRTSPS